MFIVYKFKLFILFCVNIFALLQNAQSQNAQVSLTPAGSIRINEGEPLRIECCVNGSIPGLRAIFYKNHIHVGHERATTATVHIQQATLHDCGKYMCYAYTEFDGVRKSYGVEVVEVEIIPNRRRSFNCGEYIEVSCDYGKNVAVNPSGIVWKRISRHDSYYSYGEKLKIPNCRVDDSGEYGCFYDNRPLYKTRITVLPSTDVAKGIPSIVRDPNDFVSITCKNTEHVDQAKISWRKGNTNVDFNRCFYTGNQLFLANIVPEDSGEYSCYCDGRELYRTQLVVKPFIVRVDLSSNAEAIQYGPSGSTYRKCSATTNCRDSSRLRVDWYDNKNQLISGVSTKPYRVTKSIVGNNPVMIETTLEITDAEPKHSGFYECRATVDTYIDRQSFHFSVNDYNIDIKLDRHNLYLNEYSNEAVTCTGWTTNSLGSEKLTVEWYDNNNKLITNNPSPQFSISRQKTYTDKLARLEIRNPTEQNQGFYTCVATDGVKTRQEMFYLYFNSIQPLTPSVKTHDVVMRTELTPYCLKLKEGEPFKISCELNSDMKFKIDLYHQPDYFNQNYKTRVGVKNDYGVYHSVLNAKATDTGIYECYGHNSKEVISYNRISVEVEAAKVETTKVTPPILQNCMSYERKCTRGGCYPLWYYCDGIKDCNDGEDEACVGLLSRDSYCKPSEYKCKNQQKCIPKRQLCDGVSQCKGGDDEKCTSPVVNQVKADKNSVYEGETVEISCQASGYPVPFIYWELNDADVCKKPRCVLSSINGQGTLKIQNATVSDSGLYVCIARNGKDTIKSIQPIKLEVLSKESRTESAEIIIKDDEPNVFLDSMSDVIQNGASGTILKKCTVIANSTDPSKLNADWYDTNGQAILESVSPFQVIKRKLGEKPVIFELILNITNAEQKYSGNYECRATTGSNIARIGFNFKVSPVENVKSEEEKLNQNQNNMNTETDKPEINAEKTEKSVTETKVFEEKQEEKSVEPQTTEKTEIDKVQEPLEKKEEKIIDSSIKTGEDATPSETTQKEDSIETEETTKSEDEVILDEIEKKPAEKKENEKTVQTQTEKTKKTDVYQY